MRTLGIIVCTVRRSPPFHEAGFFKRLALEGRRLGVGLLIFSPKQVDWNRRRVKGWTFSTEENRWVAGEHPLPTLVYDRCFYTHSSQYREYKPFVMRLDKDPRVQLLGRGLVGKWDTHLILSRNASLLPHLPETRKWEGPDKALSFLRQHRKIVIKPNGGSHGRGVAAIQHSGNGYQVHGRTRENRFFHLTFDDESSLKQWLSRFVATTRYVMQPYLELNTPDGRPYDLRMLIQKNETGEWITTGMAIRTGKPHSLTSNLHGGGRAERAVPFLLRHFRQEQVEDIMEKIHWLAAVVPPHIERHHGRLLELGLDVGIDTDGRVWLLEVNSKPGRSVFILSGQKDVYRQATLLPIRVAQAIFNRQTGG
jgi:glutathione synthase/RimK-type ligase-like ATP-grasp enzyme